ncbi:GIY-YIG nuclease family protein [Candidatus Dependentiae bacterium]|nr:GIY-YIG nuclease family protein [Candidatus Dependentiae bacterium]MBU4387104.1 GIY-YIG nuclease family protein [Candidatus Dependentiae bacterium]
MNNYFIYMLTNKPYGTLYIGVTNNLKRRITEHKLKIADSFTKKHNLNLLVYIEQFDYIEDAIAREKQLKGWHRNWKIKLIEKFNSAWHDLFYTIFEKDKEYEDWILNQVQDDTSSSYD